MELSCYIVVMLSNTDLKTQIWKFAMYNILFSKVSFILTCSIVSLSRCKLQSILCILAKLLLNKVFQFFTSIVRKITCRSSKSCESLNLFLLCYCMFSWAFPNGCVECKSINEIIFYPFLLSLGPFAFKLLHRVVIREALKLNCLNPAVYQAVITTFYIHTYISMTISIGTVAFLNNE